MVRFGPSGNSESFYEQGFKSSVQMPKWLKNIGLTAYEYQCNKGVRIGEERAREIGQEAKANEIFMSIHAPYYINMASEDAEKRQNSKRYIFETLRVARLMDAKRIVVHTGSCGKACRRDAVDTASKLLVETIKEADDQGYSDILICPEVLGKMNQLGDLDEILEICKVDDRVIPTVDFGHLHARGMGSLNSIDDFEKVLNKIERELGFERLKNLHCHFSRIEFTTGGEKKHWTYSDTQFGPDFDPLAELIYKKGLEPVIICESRDYMAEDALKLKHIYENIAGGKIQ